MITPLSINGPRLLARLDAFAALGATAGGGVDRQALTVEDRAARRMLADLAAARGFQVTQDDIANLFIRRPGDQTAAAPLLIGSHLDSQPTGGRFDGALGVLAAFEVLETLEDAGLQTALPIKVVAWTNEEGCRFAPGSMGSQAFANAAMPNPATVGTDGATLSGELDATLAALADVPRRPLGGTVSGYLELHIEQGPVLERLGIPIGVVSGVQGTRWLQAEITGQAAHAGTTPREARRDPVAAATSGLSTLLSGVMQEDEAARLTVGRITANPGSINAVPHSVAFTLDLRHPDQPSLDALEGRVRDTLEHAAHSGGCEVAIRRIFDMPAARFSDAVQAAIETAASQAGLKTRTMVSGAFHDALFLARIAPSGMIFVPCRDGISHNENEYVEPEAAVSGAQVLLLSTLETIKRLAADDIAENAGAAPAAAPAA